MADFTKKTPPHEGRMVVTLGLRLAAAALLNEDELDDEPDLVRFALSIVDGTWPEGTYLDCDQFYALRHKVIKLLKRYFADSQYDNITVWKPQQGIRLEDWLETVCFYHIDDLQPTSNVDEKEPPFFRITDVIGPLSYEI